MHIYVIYVYMYICTHIHTTNIYVYMYIRTHIYTSQIYTINIYIFVKALLLLSPDSCYIPSIPPASAS